MQSLPSTDMRCPADLRRQGFSLIELAVVVLMIGIMAVVAGPKYLDSMDSHRAEAAAKRIRSDLDLARRNARTGSTPRTVAFDVGSHSYSLPGIDHPHRPGADYAVHLADTGYAASLVSADFGGNADVTFDRYGRPDNGGTVVVRSGRHQQTISVNETSGRVSIP